MRSEPNAQNGASQRVIAASAPGKVILSGEHSVVYNRRAIATTLSLRLTVRLERCQTNTIALISQVSVIFQKSKNKTRSIYRKFNYTTFSTNQTTGHFTEIVIYRF